MRAAIAAVLVLGLGAAVYCCGPKAKPPSADYVCPGRTCESDELGEFNCICPE